MSPMRLIILAVAAAAAIVAALLVRNMTATETSTAQPEVVERIVEMPETRVLVAREDLPVGTLLTPENVEWRDWPERAVSPNYFEADGAPNAVELVTGSVVRTTLYENEPVIPQKIVSKGETGYMAALLKPGKRAIAVEISPESASAGFILPDDRVDVILTYELESTSGPMPVERPVTKTILRNARVLAIDQTFGEIQGTVALTGSTATLELDPQQAELVSLAARMGTISLSLRSYADAGNYDGETLGDLELLESDGGGDGVRVFRSGTAGGQP